MPGGRAFEVRADGPVEQGDGLITGGVDGGAPCWSPFVFFGTFFQDLPLAIRRGACSQCWLDTDAVGEQGAIVVAASGTTPRWSWRVGSTDAGRAPR